MAVLHLGELRFRGSPSELIQAATGHAWELKLPPGHLPDPTWQVVSQVQTEEGTRLRVVGRYPAGPAEPVTPTLEEAYLVLMGKESANLRE
jgi:hypothetical protein